MRLKVAAFEHFDTNVEVRVYDTAGIADTEQTNGRLVGEFQIEVMPMAVDGKGEFVRVLVSRIDESVFGPVVVEML